MSKALYDVVGGKSRKVGKVYGVVPAVVGVSKNLLPVYELKAIESNGVLYQDGVYCERNADGSIHVYGTAQEIDNKFYIVNPIKQYKLPSGTYTMSIGATLPGNVRLAFEYYGSTGTNWLGNYGNINASYLTRSVEISEEHSLSLYLLVPVGMTVDITLYPQLEEGSVATEYVPYGEVIRSVARKIKKSYDVIGGKTKQFYSSDAFGSYNGAYSVSDVTIDGVAHKLYTLEKTGTLVLNDAAKVWMCGGGGAGGKGKTNGVGDDNGGGGGAGGYVKSGELEAGSYSVVIGSGATASTNSGGTTQVLKNGAVLYEAQGGGGGTSAYDFGSNTRAGDGGSGGSGGGGGGKGINEFEKHGMRGSGAGVSTYPFGVTDLCAHSAGGGGGAPKNYYGGWHGGSNGSNGSGRIGSGSSASTTGTRADEGKGGSGGEKGGGKGGDANNGSYKPAKAAAGSFYGAGGGGGYADSASGTASATAGNGGAGCQGVVYIAVPA